jgi:exosortase/archaeosortase family protein
MQMSKPGMQNLTRPDFRLWLSDIAGYCRERKKAWLLLCGLQGLIGVGVVHATQENATVTLLALIVWWGAWLSMDTAVIKLKGKPSTSAAVIGSLILIFCSWRAYATYHLDLMVYALFTIQAIGLALVGWPIKRYWKLGIQPLMILSLFGLQLVAMRSVPMEAVTRATARAAEFLLALFDFQVIVHDSTIHHGTGSLVVVAGCSGLPLAIQLTVTAIIFALVFPLKSMLRRITAVLLAPLIAFAVNCVRVTLLTLVHASNLPQRAALFDLIHDQWGGLLFAGIAVSLFGCLYLHWVEQQIEATTS